MGCSDSSSKYVVPITYYVWLVNESNHTIHTTLSGKGSNEVYQLRPKQAEPWQRAKGEHLNLKNYTDKALSSYLWLCE